MMKKKLLLSVLIPFFGYGFLVGFALNAVNRSHRACVDTRRLKTACTLQFLVITDQLWAKRMEAPSLAAEMMKDCGPMPLWEPILKKLSLGEKYDKIFQQNPWPKGVSKALAEEYLVLVNKGEPLPLAVLEKSAKDAASVGVLGEISAWNHWLDDLRNTLNRQRALAWDELKNPLLSYPNSDCNRIFHWHALSFKQWLVILAGILVVVLLQYWVILIF